MIGVATGEGGGITGSVLNKEKNKSIISVGRIIFAALLKPTVGYALTHCAVWLAVKPVSVRKCGL